MRTTVQGGTKGGASSFVALTTRVASWELLRRLAAAEGEMEVHPHSGEMASNESIIAEEAIDTWILVCL